MKPKEEQLAKKRTREQLIPYQWPWNDEYGRQQSLKAMLWDRKFTLLFGLSIWILVAILGFASTRNCDETWQLNFACDQAIWMIKLKTEPLVFIRSWFTAPFFHNGLDHILFVTIFGLILPVQSFEVQHGTKATVVVFFATYIFIGLFNGVLFNFGIAQWSDVAFFKFGFERNWMGGSVGFYGIIGALSYYSRKKWFLFLMVVCFEILNLTVVGIDIHISFIHLTSSLIGFVVAWLLSK